MASLGMGSLKSLDQLRSSPDAFVDSYSHTTHASLSGQSPADRFFSEPGQFRRPERVSIGRPFLLEIDRTVSADSVAVIDRTEYQVDCRFAKQRIKLRYSPDLADIFIVGPGGAPIPIRLLTGTPGLGKTTALRTFAASLSPSLYKVAYTGLSTLTVQEFYRHLASCLGAEPAFRKAGNFRMIQAMANRLAIEKRITPVIIPDEADHMGPAILDDLKILFNFEMDSRDRAVVLLAGQPRLAHTLSPNSHEAPRQRIVMNCIPDIDVGCPISSMSDIFWNWERLSGQMDAVDAATVACGLKAAAAHWGIFSDQT